MDTAPIVCVSIRPATEPLDAFAGTAGPLSSPSARLAALWRAVPTSDVLGTHLVLVAPLSLPAQTALLARVDGREANREATPVEPGRRVPRLRKWAPARVARLHVRALKRPALRRSDRT